MQFVVFLLVAVFSASSHRICYIKPDNYTSSCPGQPCLTLYQYSSQPTTTGSTFLFLPGIHSVNSTLHLKNNEMLLFRGYKNYSVSIVLLYETKSVIQCRNVKNLTIQGIKFVHSIDHSFQQLTFFEFFDCKELKLLNLTFLGSPEAPVRAVHFGHSNAVITRCLFKGNTGIGGGGALYVSGGSNITVGSCLFEGNTARYGGGALFVVRSNITVTSCLFKGNSAGGGGTLSISHESNITVASCLFEGNIAHSYGGALKVLKSNVIFDGQSATIDFTPNSKFSVGKHSQVAVSFLNNSAPLGGGLHVYKAEVRGTNINAIRNSGSAIYALESYIRLNEEVHVSRNNGVSGGGIQAELSSTSFIGNIVLEENYASGDGGAFHIVMTSLSFSGCTLFQHNRAAGDGGAVFATDSSTISLRKNVTFMSNRATNGGAIFFQNGATMKLKWTTTFTTLHNQATEYGGVIYHSDSITPYQCEFAMSEKKHVAKLPICFIYRSASSLL